MQLLALKAKLLVKLAGSLPTDPRLYLEPFSAHPARAVVSSELLLAYYEWLLGGNEVSLDDRGHVRLSVEPDKNDLQFFTSSLYKYDSDQPVIVCGMPPPTMVFIL